MADNQLVCVKRPEPSLNALFEDMYINERLVDVTLSCSDGQLQAHKLVLAACSSYFSSIFDKLVNPFHYPVIVIKDVQIEDLRLMIDFMYKGQLTVSQEKLQSLVKDAHMLQINGLSNIDGLVTSPVDPSDAKLAIQRYKRNKKTVPSAHGLHYSAAFGRTYHHQHSRASDDRDQASAPRAERMLEQIMITGESLDDSQQFNYANDPTSTRSLNNTNNHQLHTPTPSMQHLNVDHQQQHQQLTNHLQVLSHSLTANRTTSGSQVSPNGNNSNQLPVAQHPRGRVHSCNICGKTFREKANLKRHLQVHSSNRVLYACPDCNKTFSWKDNYSRHTKTAHHMNNARSR